MKPSDCYFVVDGDEPISNMVSIMLTPIIYYDEHHYFDDQSISDSIEGLPDDWDEVMEACFVVEGFENNAEGLRELAVSLGFVPLPEG